MFHYFLLGYINVKVCYNAIKNLIKEVIFMNGQIFNPIPFEITMDTLNDALKLRNRKRLLNQAQILLDQTNAAAVPKALVISGSVDEKTETRIVINGAAFTSPKLMANLDEGDALYAYIATCGTEIDAYAASLTDQMDLFMMDGIMNLLVGAGKAFVSKQVGSAASWPDIYDYVPGAGEAWPKEEQVKLFNLFGGYPAEIGVSMEDAAFVLPRRSTIGILSKTK
ncbi:MAG: hypothetical protein EUB_03412 [Eubacterium sp.]|uniref:Uncharacterized protein n=2 Tax=Eubacteriaceae TaxID=186806 RepID=A0A4P9C3A8_EUBML|nr:vitamin B12 dependent methionine synthase activation domain-containing protein [Eubacterium limosum]QCT69767.1 hypothetical protein CPZ25_000085 [Eubacterium maltosivorans]